MRDEGGKKVRGEVTNEIISRSIWTGPAQLVKKFPRRFMEPEDSLPYSQAFATGSYPEPDGSNQHPSILFLQFYHIQ
jgi:hypothetical protein